jgi:hypothetical protein
MPPLLSQLPFQHGDPLIPSRKQRRRLLVLLLLHPMILKLSGHPEPGEKVSLRRRLDATHPDSVDDILGRSRAARSRSSSCCADLDS